MPDGFVERVRLLNTFVRWPRNVLTPLPTQPGKTPGMIDVRRWGWFGEIVGEKPCARCDATGTLRCPRCQGKKVLLYRSAAWR